MRKNSSSHQDNESHAKPLAHRNHIVGPITRQIVYYNKIIKLTELQPPGSQPIMVTPDTYDPNEASHRDSGKLKMDHYLHRSHLCIPAPGHTVQVWGGASIGQT